MVWIACPSPFAGNRPVPLDLAALLKQYEGRNYDLHEQHVNPQFAKVLRTIGFDRCYARGLGPYLWDVHGTKYLDFLSGYGMFSVGRNHPDVIRALTDFLHAEQASLVQLEAPLLSGLLAQELKKRMPTAMDIVYFTNSGTEGIETAIKFARCATGRLAILHCRKAFHGLSTGSLALNGDDTFRDGFGPFLPETRAIPFNDLAALEQALAKGDVAAFVVEPIQGKGVNIPASDYLREAARLCRKAGALFVADEVQTGIGRTGKFLAIEHDGAVEPDIIVLSKALSGGFVPVGAVLTRRAIYDKVFSSMDRAVVHSSTFGQGAMAMVAGLATLAVMDDEKLPERAKKYGDMIGHGLRAMMPRYEFMKDVRWRGLMIGIEFGSPSSLGLKAAWTLAHKMDKSLFPQAVTMPLLDDHHILTQVAGHAIDVIKLLPPLVIDESDVLWFLSAFEKVMDRLHTVRGPTWDVVSRIGRMALTSRGR
ncbi:Aspartate aminotransferase family protein [uncultured Gammaproteobacteria bacterium]